MPVELIEPPENRSKENHYLVILKVLGFNCNGVDIHTQNVIDLIPEFSAIEY